MTSSILQGVRSVEALDFSNREHRALIFDLALCNQQHLLNDYDNDIVLIINYYQREADAGFLRAFIALIDNQPAGCFWVEMDRYETGRIRGALFPQYRNAWNGAFFMRFLVDYGFNILELRKLDAELALYSRKDRGSAAAERLLKRIGFKKRAILPEALMIDGSPKDTILLDFLKRDYDVQTQETK